MYLKRIYERDKDGRAARDEHGNLKPPIGVVILGLGATPQQHFTLELVSEAIAQGWMSLEGERLVVKGANREVAYKVLRAPGYYCCHCKAALAAGGETARAHLAAAHAGKKSPDPQNPAGYERIHYFDCVEAQPRGRA